MKETDIAWLADIVDGEGTVSFGVSTRHGGRLCIVPLVIIINSDEAILAKSQEVLRQIVGDASVGRQSHNVTSNSSFKGRKACYSIRVASWAVELVLNAIYPHMVCEPKRIAARAIMEFIAYRRDNLLERDKRGRITRVGYPKHLVELVASVRSHKNAKSLSEMLRAKNVH